MIVAQQDDGAGGLDVEGARSVEDGVLDELNDASVGDWRCFF